MIQHVSEWTCKCADCGQVVKLAIKMNMSDGIYLAMFEKHEHPDGADLGNYYVTLYTVSAPTLDALRERALPRHGYTVTTEG